MKISKRHLLNYSILIPYLLLSVLGLIVVYSTTSATLIQEGKSTLQLVRNQGIFWIASLFLIALIYKLKLGFLRNERLIFIVMFVELILLALARFNWDSCQWGLWLDQGWSNNDSTSRVFKNYHCLVSSTAFFKTTG
ncbi:cell division protein FtsW [Streptococcus infantis SK1302]|uniref:Cell division protein FtsW n=1 Tax=Streptococcus infantis SK1302 TaxID=871237 RepID=A0ABN0B2Y3_9STRE|nr:cell division protein FtsW [Streptococcus infantis SK1302]